MSHSDQYFLTTPRLGWRRWSTEDLPLALSLWGDSEVGRFIGGPFSHEKVQQHLATEIALMTNHNVQYWPMFLLVSDDLVGCGGLRPYKLEDQIYELGIHLRPAYWGKGFGEEAGRALISFAFDSLGAEALFAGHHPENAASRKLLDKLGFRYTHHEFYPPMGEDHPSYLLQRSESSANSKSAP